MLDYILEMKHITKEFPGVKALDDVSLSVLRGEIHAVVGENGALWYEETLPPETVLYVTLAATNSRRAGAQTDAQAVLGHALSLFPDVRPYLQLGGNETVGMGWCRIATVQASVSAKAEG